MTRTCLLLIAPMFLLVGFWRMLEREYPGWRQILIPVLLVVLALITRARLRDWEGPYPLWKSAAETEALVKRAGCHSSSYRPQKIASIRSC